jgi:hypothetical protein
MKKNDIAIVVLFFLFVGPGPVVFFLNKYTVTFLPIATLAAALWLIKDEIRRASFDAVLKDRQTYQWMFFALKYAIFAHAITTIAVSFVLPGHKEILSESLLGTYLVAPVYVVFLGPVLEEIVYRKILFGFLYRKLNNFWAAGIPTSLLFAAGHFSLERLPAYIAVGLIFCHTYRKSGSVMPSMLAHAGLNLIAVLVSTLRG